MRKLAKQFITRLGVWIAFLALSAFTTPVLATQRAPELINSIMRLSVNIVKEEGKGNYKKAEHLIKIRSEQCDRLKKLAVDPEDFQLCDEVS